VRIPSSLNGLFGVKPSRGRVSSGPLAGELTGLSVNGPLARTVPDAAAMLDAMAIPQPGDPFWAAPLPAGETFLGHALAGLRGDVGRLRIGRHIDNVLGAPVHPDCVQAWEEASELLVGLGHEVVDIAVPVTGDLLSSFMVLWAVTFASVPVDPAREHLLRPLTAMLREQGRATPAVAFAEAMRAVQLASRGAIEATGAFDAVLTPTLAQPPQLVGAIRDDDNPAADFVKQGLFTPYTAVYNVSGQPAVSVPLHWTPDGLPIGVQFVGRPGDEATLLRLSGQLQVAQPWTERHPELW
jgi:amidase